MPFLIFTNDTHIELGNYFFESSFIEKKQIWLTLFFNFTISKYQANTKISSNLIDSNKKKRNFKH